MPKVSLFWYATRGDNLLTPDSATHNTFCTLGGELWEICHILIWISIFIKCPFTYVAIVVAVSFFAESIL